MIAGGKSPLYKCYLCDHETHARQSTCPGCGRFDTLIREDGETPEQEDDRRAKHAVRLSLRAPRFISTGSAAWDTVLGGGFVRPSSVLVYGPRGVGKSTRALGLALHVGELTRGKVLYGSAEMPAEHIRLYAERVGASKAALSRLWVQDSSDAVDMLDNIEQIRPAIVIWDSIQRMTWEGELGDTELRNVVHQAINAGRRQKLVSILLSQVGKDGAFLGPNGIVHDVDVAVRLTRDDRDLVIETPDKNRFAPTPLSARESFLTK